MAIDPATYYSTVTDANAYFANRLHQTDWAIQSTERREQALLAATQDVDALKFSGFKTTVYDLLQTDPDASAEEIAAADAAQPLKFPRNGETEIPQNFLYAVYEVAYERLRGRDPQQEAENLSLTNYGAGSTRESRDVSGAAQRHLANGIVSYMGFRWLLPYLASANTFDIKRV